MKNLQFYKKRFFFVLALWTVLFFSFVFLIRPFLLSSQLSVTEKALALRKNLNEQKAQQDNLARAEKSLIQLKSSVVQPEDLLPREDTLVEEIRLLESWAKGLDLELRVKVSGSLATAKKTDLKTGVVLVPMTLGVRGSALNTFHFMRLLEKSALPYKVDNMSLLSENHTEQTIFTILVGNIYVSK